MWYELQIVKEWVSLKERVESLGMEILLGDNYIEISGFRFNSFERAQGWLGGYEAAIKKDWGE